MAYDEGLADRIRAALDGRDDLSERKMFGGIAFMVSGNMCVGVTGGDLMVRLGPNGHEAALGEPNVRPMDFTGRPMKGFVFVEQAGIPDEESLQRWVDEAVDFAGSLPPK